MKKIIFSLFALLFIGITASAQVSEQEVDIAQNALGKEKAIIVAEAIGIPVGNDDSFWALYDTYENEREVFGKNRVGFFNEYIKNYDTYSEKELDALIEKMSKNRANYDKALDKAYASIKKDKGTKTAFKFLQVELYFQSAIRSSIMESMFIMENLGD